MQKIRFALTNSNQTEVLLAFLTQLPFVAFEELPNSIDGYVDDNAMPDIEEEIKHLQAQFPFAYTIEAMPEKNWNAIWESEFQPITVGNFCSIRADFHPPAPQCEYDIIIQPKMAFGTGHHATTYMMVEAMQSMSFAEKSVFDYGCGTGILAILAAKMGAKDIIAIDNDENAVENTTENCHINAVSTIDIRHTILEHVKLPAFDTILANINRNVIIESLPALAAITRGSVLISGFLNTDTVIMEKAVSEAGFNIVAKWSREEWECWKID